MFCRRSSCLKSRSRNKQNNKNGSKSTPDVFFIHTRCTFFLLVFILASNDTAHSHEETKGGSRLQGHLAHCSNEPMPTMPISEQYYKRMVYRKTLNAPNKSPMQDPTEAPIRAPYFARVKRSLPWRLGVGATAGIFEENPRPLPEGCHNWM